MDFFEKDDGEILLSRDARDGAPAPAAARRRDDERPFVLRAEGVADADGNARAAHGEDRFAVQDVRAHVGKFPQFLIGHFADALGRRDDARIAGEKAADVRPVFVQGGAHRPRHDRAGNIASAPGKGLYLSVRARPVKAGNDRVRVPAERRRGLYVRLVVQRALRRKKDDVLRVHERPAEQGGHDARGEIFPAGSAVIPARPRADLLFDAVEFPAHADVLADLLFDPLEPGADAGKDLAEILSRRGEIVTAIEEIGDLHVPAEPLSGGGNDDVAALRIGADDIRRAAHDIAVRHGRAAEFAYLDVHKISRRPPGASLFIHMRRLPRGVRAPLALRC